MIDCPSPNFDARRLPVSMVVLHYTGMVSAEAALARLTDASSRVSAHYLIAEDGTVLRLVDEAARAWHAGAGGWRDIDDVNSASVGIELANPGHEFGYVPFAEPQIAALEPLLEAIRGRHRIASAMVVGHSDIAPSRKEDPGELFPWQRLAARGLAIATPKASADPGWTDAGADRALARWGYRIENAAAARRAFQRRFRPALLDGEWDGESRAILLALLLAADL